MPLEGSTSSSAEEAPMPYQVHRKVMGWKLTSVPRRRNLVGMLDLVNNARLQRSAGAVGAGELGESHVSSKVLKARAEQAKQVRDNAAVSISSVVTALVLKQTELFCFFCFSLLS
jgi:hypothetical protein